MLWKSKQFDQVLVELSGSAVHTHVTGTCFSSRKLAHSLPHTISTQIQLCSPYQPKH